MKKLIKLPVLLISTALLITFLTSGISKEKSDGGGYKDLVDELYDQAVKQNDNLQSIEDGIDKFYKKRSDAMEKYNGFTSYNNRYYSDARAKVNSISDSAAKRKANDLISRSEAAYYASLTEWQTIIASLNKKEKEMNDLHTLLKIVITEPVIKKYQDGNMPDNNKLKEAANDLQNIINRIREITK